MRVCYADPSFWCHMPVVQCLKQNLTLVLRGKDSPSRNVHWNLYAKRLFDRIITMQRDQLPCELLSFTCWGCHTPTPPEFTPLFICIFLPLAIPYYPKKVRLWPRLHHSCICSSDKVVLPRVNYRFHKPNKFHSMLMVGDIRSVKLLFCCKLYVNLRFTFDDFEMPEQFCIFHHAVYLILMRFNSIIRFILLPYLSS